MRPRTFVESLPAHEGGHVALAGRAWRRPLATRVTDLAVRERTRLVPLSVAADKIALPAMRCAGLLAQLAAAGAAVDRRSTGAVVEVYTAASQRVWGLPWWGSTSGTLA